MKNNQVIISVSGGVSEIVAEPKDLKTWVVDFDNLESGACPLCGMPIEFVEGEQFCKACGIFVNCDDAVELVNRYDNKHQHDKSNK